MKKLIPFLLLLFVPVVTFALDPQTVWDLPPLKKAPVADWGPVLDRTIKDDTGKQVQVQTQKVWYESGPYRGKPTRVFAFFSKPVGNGPFPGMVLVHGGGGTAYSRWTELWAARGYAAIAMDLSGDEIVPDKSNEGDQKVRRALANGGPQQSNEMKFNDFSVEKKEYRDRWPWQSIASIMRAHSLLDSLPCVDPERTGATGISWGGYLTSMLSGIDDRFQVIVPVYGCGFLNKNTAWTKQQFESWKDPERIARWMKYSDPSSWMGNAKCRVFFVNGTDDFSYPLDSHRDCFNLVQGADVRLQVAMPHSHISGWAPREIAAYVNSVLKGGDPLPCLENLQTTKTDSGYLVTAHVKYQAKPVAASLFYTTDQGGFNEKNRWQVRKWTEIPAKIEGETIKATLPVIPNVEPGTIRFYLQAKDSNGLTATTHFGQL